MGKTNAQKELDRKKKEAAQADKQLDTAHAQHEAEGVHTSPPATPTTPTTPPTQDPELAALEARRLELSREVEALEKKKVDAINAVVNIDATIEQQIRDEYQSGALNYNQIALKYRIVEEEVRRIIGDQDLVPEVDDDGKGGSLNELPEEV